MWSIKLESELLLLVICIAHSSHNLMIDDASCYCTGSASPYPLFRKLTFSSLAVPTRHQAAIHRRRSRSRRERTKRTIRLQSPRREKMAIRLRGRNTDSEAANGRALINRLYLAREPKSHGRFRRYDDYCNMDRNLTQPIEGFTYVDLQRRTGFRIIIMMQLLLARKVPLWMGATLGKLAIRFGALGTTLDLCKRFLD